MGTMSCIKKLQLLDWLLLTSWIQRVISKANAHTKYYCELNSEITLPMLRLALATFFVAARIILARDAYFLSFSLYSGSCWKIRAPIRSCRAVFLTRSSWNFKAARWTHWVPMLFKWRGATFRAVKHFECVKDFENKQSSSEQKSSVLRSRRAEKNRRSSSYLRL